MRIKGLDGLRAVAFLLVFFFHVNWLPFGWVGVQLFYVLSGFLITGILTEMKPVLSGGMYFVKFYGRRFLRIFPLYYFYLLAIWLIVRLMESFHFKTSTTELFHDHFPYALAYFYNFFMATKYFVGTSVFLSHFWSLAVEEQFYIVWPLLILLTPQKKQKHVFIGIILLSTLFRLVTLMWASTHSMGFLQHDPNLLVYVLPFSHIDAFALGALLTVIKIPRARTQIKILLVSLPILGVLSTLLSLQNSTGLPLLKIISSIIASGDTNLLFNFGFPLLLADSYKAVWGYAAINYLFTLLIQGVAFEGWLNRILESQLMRYLGRISYGLYVYHFAIIWFVSVPFGFSNLTPLPFAPAAGALILTTLVASLSYRWLEKPLIDLKDKFFAVPAQN